MEILVSERMYVTFFVPVFREQLWQLNCMPALFSSFHLAGGESESFKVSLKLVYLVELSISCICYLE